MQKGDRINLKNGKQAVITRFGLPDFPGDPVPVYYVEPATGRTGWLLSSELKESRP